MAQAAPEPAPEDEDAVSEETAEVKAARLAKAEKARKKREKKKAFSSFRIGSKWRTKKGSTTFSLWCSLYADDAANFFSTRSKLQAGCAFIYKHLKRFGLTMHVGRGDKASKSEAMFCPGHGSSYEDGDTSKMIITDDGGFIEFTKSFKYLGSIITPDLASTADVAQRIKKASKVFGALRRDIFANRSVTLKAKKALYTSFVLSTLLFGSESWCLLKKDELKLERFHRSCVRAMAGVSKYKQWRRRLSSVQLERRLGLYSLGHYLQVRALRWLGHLARMPQERLPRKLLFGWVDHPKPVGCPRMSYGRRMAGVVKRALAKAAPGVQRLVEGHATRNGPGGIGWYRLAQNRQMWRRLVHAGSGDGRALPASPSRRRPPQQQQPLQLHENTCYNFISTHPWVGPTPWWHQGWWWNKGAALHDRRPPYLEKQWR